MTRFGIAVGAYSAGVPDARALTEFARTAEAVGFDSIQVGDHIQWHAPIHEATVVVVERVCRAAGARGHTVLGIEHEPDDRHGDRSA